MTPSVATSSAASAGRPRSAFHDMATTNGAHPSNVPINPGCQTALRLFLQPDSSPPEEMTGGGSAAPYPTAPGNPNRSNTATVRFGSAG